MISSRTSPNALRSFSNVSGFTFFNNVSFIILYLKFANHTPFLYIWRAVYILNTLQIYTLCFIKQNKNQRK
nr:MAG TPA: hypothetical protein [Caudoviricetes sp.]